MTTMNRHVSALGLMSLFLLFSGCEDGTPPSRPTGEICASFRNGRTGEYIDDEVEASVELRTSGGNIGGLYVHHDEPPQGVACADIYEDLTNFSGPEVGGIATCSVGGNAAFDAVSVSASRGNDGKLYVFVTCDIYWDGPTHFELHDAQANSGPTEDEVEDETPGEAT